MEDFCPLCHLVVPKGARDWDGLLDRTRLGKRIYHASCLLKHYIKVRDANRIHKQGEHTRVPGIVSWFRRNRGPHAQGQSV